MSELTLLVMRLALLALVLAGSALLLFDVVVGRTAGWVAGAAVLAGLPVAGIALGQLIGARPLEFLCGPGAGGWLLVTGVLLACVGLLWSDRIIERALR